jgi:hypothetical protein
MDLWSVEEICDLLREQARMRSMENDTAGILEKAAVWIELKDKEVQG